MADNITLTDISLKEFPLSALPLAEALRTRHFQTKTHVCIERAKLITEYLKNNAPEEFPELTRAKAVNHYLSNRQAIINDDNPLAGSTTSKDLGAPLYPEFIGLTIWPELETISNREINPQILSEEDANYCNLEIFPYWMEKNVLETTRKKFRKNNQDPQCLKLMEKIVFYICGKAGCVSHCVPFYEKVLNKGLDAIIQEAKLHEDKLKKGSAETDKRKIAFYQSIRIALRGILNYSENLAKKAEELAGQESDPIKKNNLEAISKVCSRVPANPPRTFREAVNALWLCQVGVHAENVNMAVSPGRLDQILYPFYKKDVEENGLTVQEALTISCCLWLKLSDNTNLVPETAEKLWGGAGSTPAVTLGGVDAQGEDAVNDLTYILLKVTEIMKLRDPSVNSRYNYEKNDLTYRNRLSEVIINTKAIPAIHNDIADIQSLENQGITPEHARDFAIIGCVELAASGRDYASSSSIMLNLASAMEMTLLNGKRFITGEEQIGPKTGDPAGFTDFDQFWNAFKAQLKWLIEQAIELNEMFGEVHRQILPTPLLSAFFEGPMEKGMDLILGGALYNSSGASHVAFPDVCDSLNAIEFAVFQEKRISMQDIIEAVKTDFGSEDYQKLLPYLKNKAPKFGSEHPTAIKNSLNLVRFIYDIYQSRVNYRGGKYRPAYWTMTTHAGQGKLAGALPSGRKARQVFSSGITPTSQAAQNLTEAYNAVAALPGNAIPGGVALNMKYTPITKGENREEYLKKFGDLFEGYFKKGGMQVQFNIQTYQDLIEAKKNPDKDPQMIVRVSGYSAYFNDLSDARLSVFENEEIVNFEPHYPVVLKAGLSFRGKDLIIERELQSEAGRTTSKKAKELKDAGKKDKEDIRNNTKVDLPLISYYGTGRLWPLKRHTEKFKLGSKLDAYKNCLDPNSDHVEFQKWFEKQETVSVQKGAEIPPLEAARNAVVESIPDCEGFCYDIQFGRIVLELKNKEYCPFDNLSDGYKNMVGMVADIAHRAARLNPHFGANAAEKTPGVVLIDEIDLHLHPKWQRMVVGDLQRTFPNIQFIVTTHSPFIIQSAASGEVIDLDQPILDKSSEILDDLAAPGSKAEHANRSIEDIAEEVMGVDVPQRSRGNHKADRPG